MSSKKNHDYKIDPQQREMIEKAQARARQKKRLNLHFIVFLIGSVILILLNIVFEIGKDIRPFGLDWFAWAIIFWGVILLLHTFNVYVTNKFLGKDWEERQVERLVAKQQKRIDELQQKVERKHPLPPSDETLPPKNKPTNPDAPINS